MNIRIKLKPSVLLRLLGRRYACISALIASAIFTGCGSDFGTLFDKKPSAPVVYWCESSGTIGRISVDGTGMKTLASTENIPLDLAVDPPNGKIYWVEETAGTKYSIMQCGIGDGIVAEVYSVQTVSGLGPLSIAVNTASGNIIWCRYQTSALVNGLWYSPLSSVPLAPVKLVNNVPEPYAYSMSVDSINGRVYLTANSYHDLGTALGSGNTGGIFVYDIDTSGLVASYTDTGSSSESIPFKGVAVDPAGGHVYYISKTLAYYNLIRRRDLNLENAETWVAVSGDNIQKLALDLVNRKIYWTSEAGGGIYRADMDTADSNVEIFLQPGSAVAGIAVSQ